MPQSTSEFLCVDDLRMEYIPFVPGLQESAPNAPFCNDLDDYIMVQYDFLNSLNSVKQQPIAQLDLTISSPLQQSPQFGEQPEEPPQYEDNYSVPQQPPSYLPEPETHKPEEV